MSGQRPGGWRGPVILSAGGHLVLVVALLVSLDWHRPADLPSPAQGEIIQATSIAAEELDSARAEIAEQERQRQAAREAAERRRREEARRQAEAEERRRQEAAEAQRQAEAEEQRRQEQAEARRQAEAEAERQRQAEAEAERQRQAEEERRRREAEEQRRREEEAARQAAEEAERRRQEAEEALRRAAEAEAERRREAERQARLQSLEQQYVAELQAHVERHWIRPAQVPEGLVCVVVARQIPGGEVVDVAVSDCNAPADVIRSIENAVYRSSPLPPPPDEAVFARTIQFRFRGDSA